MGGQGLATILVKGKHELGFKVFGI